MNSSVQTPLDFLWTVIQIRRRSSTHASLLRLPVLCHVNSRAGGIYCSRAPRCSRGHLVCHEKTTIQDGESVSEFPALVLPLSCSRHCVAVIQPLNLTWALRILCLARALSEESPSFFGDAILTHGFGAIKCYHQLLDYW